MRAITLRHHDMPPAALGELQQFSHASEMTRPLARSAVVVFLLLIALLCLALGAVPSALRNVASTLRQDGSLGVALASSLTALCGLTVTLGLVRARHETWRREGCASSHPGRNRRGLTALRDRIAARLRSDHAIVSLVASSPQTLIVSLFMAAAGFALWRLWPARELPPAPLLRQEWFALAAATIVFAFPLLVCRRIVADVPPVRLPEAPRLARLLAVPIAFLLAL
ncbi:MAG: hypothetical protein JO255_19435, partial [Alphaproteobacteria bacterium]|nr:hypothetical protein [Alphaproteobacteria bacterium]